MRSFAAEDGTIWRVWRVESPDEHINAAHPGRSRTWLAFQNALGSERRRLFEIPDDWMRLPDEQLEMLRRVAQPVKGLRQPSVPKNAEYAERSPDADIDA